MKPLDNNTKNILQEKLSVNNGTYIEIAGPSPDGYAILTENNISLPKLEVTNLSNPIVINPYAEHPLTVAVDKVVNVRTMPYALNSIDAFFCSYLSYISDIYLSLKPKFVRTAVSRVLSYFADRDYKNINVNSRFNLRIIFLRESYKRLVSGGLVILVGPMSNDLNVAKKIGYKILEENYTDIGDHDTVVLQKV